MTSLALNEMTVSEKLRAMELLWDDLCRSGNAGTPEWHLEVLKERESAEDSRFTALDEAKERIRSRVS